MMGPTINPQMRPNTETQLRTAPIINPMSFLVTVKVVILIPLYEVGKLWISSAKTAKFDLIGVVSVEKEFTPPLRLRLQKSEK